MASYYFVSWPGWWCPLGRAACSPAAWAPAEAQGGQHVFHHQVGQLWWKLFVSTLSFSLRLEKVKQLHVTAPPNVFSLATFRLIREGFPSLQEMVWKVEEQNGRKWQSLVSSIYELENTNAKIYFQLMRVIPAVLLLSSIGFLISYIFQ